MFAVPDAVPRPPVVAVASPTRNGTIWVFFSAALIPVVAATVVPTKVGPLLINFATLDEPLFAPSLTPLTKFVALPAAWVKVPAVRVATPVPPKRTVIVELPIPESAPIVSVEFVVSEPL